MKNWLEIIFDEQNIDKALRRTIGKNTCAGTDRITAKQLKRHWECRGTKIIRAIYQGEYYPLPSKRLYINKGNGKKRKLTVPTMQDRMIQRCIVNVLGDYYEQFFHEDSFGFRKGRGPTEAIEKVRQYLNAGFRYVIDLDIESCFDSMRHSLVMELIQRKIDDEKLLLLIKRYMKVNILFGSRIIRINRGVMQGGPISSLLANIVLNELDWYLYSEGISFVRYADDVVIFCKSLDEAKQNLEMTKLYLKKYLQLKINMEKTNIVKAEELEYLGMAFKENGQIYELTINENIKQKMYRKMLKYFRKTHKKGVEFWDMLGGFHRGWLNYYRQIDKQEIRAFLGDAQEYEDEITKKYIPKEVEQLQEKQIALIQSRQYISFEKWLEKMNIT